MPEHQKFQKEVTKDTKYPRQEETRAERKCRSGRRVRKLGDEVKHGSGASEVAAMLRSGTKPDRCFGQWCHPKVHGKWSSSGAGARKI